MNETDHNSQLMKPSLKPIFNKRIFWDVDFEALDYEAKASFVIERVFERGDVEDIRQCRKHYGDKKITTVSLNAKYLPERSMYLAAAVVDKPLTDFRCYRQRQLNQELYPY